MDLLRRFGIVLFGAVLGALICAILVSSPAKRAAAAPAVSQEDDEAAKKERAAARKELRERLEEIERAVEEAEKQGNADKVRQLRREGERVLDRLEQIQRAEKAEEREEPSEREEEERERHRHRFHLELARMETEIGLSRLAKAGQLAQVAASPEASAAYAVSIAGDILEDDAVEFLQEALKATKNERIQRILQFKLIELMAERDEGRDEAAELLKKLITANPGQKLKQ